MRKLITPVLFWLGLLLIHAQECLNLEASDINGNSNINIDCNYPFVNNECFTLQANFTETKSTTSYLVDSLNFNNSIPVNSGNPVNVNVPDDTWGEIIDLPFSFCYFGNTYSRIVVADNGLVSFNTSYSGTSCVFTAASLPNTSLYRNTIYALYHDLTNDDNVIGCNDNPNTTNNECGEILVRTIGDYPCRKFVVNFNSINHFGCTNVKSSFQLILYEGTNEIEVNVYDKPENCESPNPLTDYRKKATIGLLNSSGTIAYFPTYRNANNFVISNKTYRFVPAGAPNYQINWLNEVGDVIGNTSEITICEAIPQIYTAQVTYDQCGAEPIILNQDVNVQIDPDFPVANDLEVTMCDQNLDGVEIVNLNNYNSQISNNSSGNSISYYSNQNDAQTGSNPITNPNNYSANNNSIVYARVAFNQVCFSIAEISFQYSAPATINSQNFDICDTDNDNSESINLESYTDLLVEDAENYEVSYYSSEGNAQNQINPLTNISLTGNTDFWVRASIGDCINIQSFSFTFLPTPTVNNLDLTLCKNNYYDLTQNESEIVGNSNNFTISYHRNRNQARTGASPLDAENLLISSNQYYVRVLDSNTGCYSVAIINIEYVEEDPIVDGFLIECVEPDIESSYFNLTDALNYMCIDPLNYTIEFYEDQNDADIGNASVKIPDADLVNYNVSAPNFIVYVRFVNNETGCVRVQKLYLVLSQTPDISEDYFFACQQEGSTEDLVVDLHNFDGEIVGDSNFNSNGFVCHVQYYENQTDAENETNQINEVILTGVQEIFVRLVVGYPELDENLEQLEDEDGNPVFIEVCYAIYPITIELSEISDIVETPIEICNNLNDNFETIYLSDYTSFYTSNPNYSDFRYFRHNLSLNSSGNANILVEFPFFYLEFLNESNCKIRVKFPINFISAPDLDTNVLEICDSGQDGVETVNLFDYVNQIISPVSDYSYAFYTSLIGARNENPGFLINNTSNYSITNSSQTIYARVTSNITGCANVVSINFQFQVTPDYSPDIYICEITGNTSYSNYDLSNFNSQILENSDTFEFHYFQSYVDASSQINELINADVYDSQIWYILIISELGCSYIAETELHFFNVPNLNSEIEVCNDNGGDNEEILVNELNSLIVSNPENYQFTYYSSQSDLDNHENAIDTETPINIEDGSQLFLEVKFNVGCSSTSILNINFLPAPEVFPIEYIVCDLDNNLQEYFDLPSQLNQLCPNYSQYNISYFTNENAANTYDSNSQIISDLDNYFANQEYTQIYVRFENPNTGCYSVGQLTLHISPIPKLLNASYSACDENSNGAVDLNLNNLNELILEDNQTGGSLSYTYFESYSDALNNINLINNPTNYSNSAPNFSIFIRVENEFGCFSVAEVDINIGTKTEINPLTESLDICDVANDMREIVDISQFQNQISTNADSFEYFTSISDMELEINEIADPSNFEVTSISTSIFIRIKEEGFCDNFTSFDINLLPVPVSNHQSQYLICEGDDTEIGVESGYASYFWPQLNATSPRVTVSESGDYQVIITNIEGCSSEYIISVQASPDPVVNIEQISANSVKINYDTSLGVLEFSLDGENFTSENVFSKLESGSYVIYMRWEGTDCIYTEEFYILVLTNIITPNDDGYNDEWGIKDPVFFDGKKATLKIYDRYSKVVYSQESANSLSWNGKYLGRNVPTETYWYTVTDGNGKEYRGWIFVKNTSTN